MQEVTVEKGKMREVFSKKLRGVEPLDVVLLAQELQTCLETKDGKACGGVLFCSNDEVQEWVCSKCGRVWGARMGADNIPYSDSGVENGHSEGSYSPETHVDWSGGLGSKIDQYLAADVLGDSGDIPEELRSKFDEFFLVEELSTGERADLVKNGKFRDPMSLRRASHTQVSLTNSLLRELLSLGSDFLKKHGFHRSRNPNHIWFSDQLGINLLYMGRFYQTGQGKLRHDRWQLAASIFCLLFKQCYPERYNSLRFKNDGETEKRFPELCLPEEVITYFGLVLKSCNPPVLPQLP